MARIAGDDIRRGLSSHPVAPGRWREPAHGPFEGLASGAGHDSAVPKGGGRAEPACAAYRRSAQRPISDALEAGRRTASEALAGLDVNWLDDVDRALFANLNTPADYRAFLAAISKTR